MLKPLRHPAVFYLLTCCIIAWLARWTHVANATPSSFRGHNHVFMPLYDAIGLVVDLPDHSPTRHELLLSRMIDREQGVTVVLTDGGEPTVVDEVPFESLKNYAQLSLVTRTHREHHEFGLLMPWVTLDHGEYDAMPLVSHRPSVPEQTAINTAAGAGELPALVTWSIGWANAAHDIALSLLLLAWLYALFTIPAWKLWRNLTPAQRRRNHHACPGCGYDRSVAPDKPCPECGSAVAIK